MFVPHAVACSLEALLEAEGAAEQEGAEVVAPQAAQVTHLGSGLELGARAKARARRCTEAAQVTHLLGSAAMAPDAVPRQARGEVGAVSERARVALARRQLLEQRARSGVEPAELAKVLGVLGRHDDQVGLHEAVRKPGRRSAM